MTLLLRKSNARARVEGWVQVWADDDYCVLDNEPVVGCIRAEVILGQPKWRWAINNVPHGLPPPHNGIANTLDDAKAAFKERYQQIKRHHPGEVGVDPLAAVIQPFRSCEEYRG